MEGADSVAELFALSIFGGAALLTVFLGIVLSFHWFRYGMSFSSATMALVAYSVASGFLLSSLLVAVLAIV